MNKSNNILGIIVAVVTMFACTMLILAVAKTTFFPAFNREEMSTLTLIAIWIVALIAAIEIYVCVICINKLIRK